MSWLVLIPVFIFALICGWKKKTGKKTTFVEHTKSNFGILFDVYNNL